jgi:hypothetical protein
MEWKVTVDSTIMALAITMLTAMVVRSYFSILSLYNMFSLVALTIKSTIGE